MPFPDHIVEIEFEPGIWSNVEATVRTFDTRRGRSRELERVEAGTAEVVFNDDARNLDPTNADGPYFGLLTPGKRIRIRAQMDTGGVAAAVDRTRLKDPDAPAYQRGAVYARSIFTGTIQYWDFDYQRGLSHIVTLRATDATETFNLANTDAGGGSSSQDVGDRIDATLDAMDPAWPAADRALDLGTMFIDSAVGTGSVWEDLTKAAAGEGGRVFVDADGRVVFYDASHVPVTDDVVWDCVGRKPMDAHVEFAMDRVWNVVNVESPGLTTQTATDATSVGRYRERTLTVPTILFSEDDMLALAEGLLARYKEPGLRVTSLELKVRDDDLVPAGAVFARELFDRIVVRIPYVNGGLIEQPCTIEGIDVSARSHHEWVVTWHLSPDETPIPANLLTWTQCSLEGSIDGWVTESGVAVSLGYAGYAGRYSLLVYPDEIAHESVKTDPYDEVPVVVGNTYRASAYFMRAQVGSSMTCHLELSWRDSGGTELSATVGSNVLIDGPEDGWRYMFVQGDAPTGAAYVVLRWATFGYPVETYGDLFILREV